MAYDILATWDFRTTDGTAARASRRDPGSGTLTLAETGTPVYTVNGVEMTSSNYLQATLAADMKPAGEHGFITAFRRIGTLNQFDLVTGIRHAEPNSTPFLMLGMQTDSSTAHSLQAANGAFNASTGAQTSGFPVLNTDTIFWLRRSSSTGASLRIDSATTDTLSLSAMSNYGSWTSTANIRFRGAFRVAWVIYFEGTMTNGERDAILAAPNDYIYPAPSGPAFRSYYITG